MMKTTFLNLAAPKVPGSMAQTVISCLKKQSNCDEVPKTEFTKLIKEDSFSSHFFTFFQLDHLSISDFLVAWTHKSICHEYKSLFPFSYERLEFLGDSILNFYVTQKLYKRYPEKKEGELSKLRSELVSGVELSVLSELIGLDHFVILGVGELKNKSYSNKSILADIFESTLAVILLKDGPEMCWRFLDQCLNIYYEKNNEHYFDEKRLVGRDSKGRLQEYTMKKYNCLPKYCSKELPNGHHEVSLYINDDLYDVEVANSKKLAEKQAAQITLQKFLGNTGDQNAH